MTDTMESHGLHFDYSLEPTPERLERRRQAVQMFIEQNRDGQRPLPHISLDIAPVVPETALELLDRADEAGLGSAAAEQQAREQYAKLHVANH